MPLRTDHREGPGPTAPRVSVVIPVYRGGPFLREAVASVLDQTVSALEVVLVSDGCPEDLSSFEQWDARVRVLRREHAGVSVARNVGVAHSASDLVAFLDEDDRAHPRRLQWQLEAFADRPGSGMCHGAFEVIDGHGAVQVGSRGGPVQYRDMLALEFPLLSTVMVRRDHFHEVGGFDPALTTGEDIEFFLRSAMRTDLTFVPRVITSYRRHGANTATGVWDIYPVLQRHRRWAELSQRPELVAAADLGLRRNRRNAARAAFDEARSARRRGAVAQVVRGLAVSLTRDPAFVPGVVWSRITGRPSRSPEGRMPGPVALQEVDGDAVRLGRRGAGGGPVSTVAPRERP
jgi:glycosyltransferase involved in cell wall biosynthesis